MTETELFRTYRETKDVALRNRIAEKYLYIAAVIAKKFVGRGVEYDDLYQVASLALVRGIDRFDERKGLQFSTFITPTVTGEIKNYFRDRSRLVHLPRRVSELRTLARKTSEEMFSESGKKPSAADIAKRLNVSEEEVLRAMEAGSVVSLDAPAEQSDGASYYEAIPAQEDAYDTFETREAVLSAIGELSDTEREMVRLRFGQELSQAETAKRMGVSQMYISRMERKILEKLRKSLKEGAAE